MSRSRNLRRRFARAVRKADPIVAADPRVTLPITLSELEAVRAMFSAPLAGGGGSLIFVVTPTAEGVAAMEAITQRLSAARGHRRMH